MLDVIFVRPEGDAVELALSSWAALVVAATYGAANVAVTELRAGAATKAAVERAISSNHLSLFFAHGTTDRIGEPTLLLDRGNSAKGLGAVVIAFSCEAGRDFGTDAITNGVRAFLGFDDLLVVYQAQPSLLGRVVEKAVTPLLLSGATIEMVRDDLKSGLQQIEHDYLHGSGRTHPDAALIWMAAHINWRGLALHGNATATVP